MDLMSMLKPVKVDEKAEKQKKVTKQEKPKESKPKEVAKTNSSNTKSYKYPFEIYLAAEKKDVSHIFEEGKSYTPQQVTKAMLEHGFYEFAGNVTYDFIEKDNVLVPVFQQHKKG